MKYCVLNHVARILTIGLRQGDVISLVLFSLLIENLNYLHNYVKSGIHIDNIVLILLLFGDYMATLVKSPEELQYNLHILNT